jgi:hypothetical protein
VERFSNCSCYETAWMLLWWGDTLCSTADVLPWWGASVYHYANSSKLLGASSVETLLRSLLAGWILMLCWQFELLWSAGIRLQRLYQDACTSSNPHTWAREGTSLADPFSPSSEWKARRLSSGSRWLLKCAFVWWLQRLRVMRDLGVQAVLTAQVLGGGA